MYHPTRLLRKMQSVGHPGRALALLSGGRQGIGGASCWHGVDDGAQAIQRLALEPGNVHLGDAETAGDLGL